MAKRKAVQNDTKKETLKKPKPTSKEPKNTVIDPEAVKKIINVTFDKSMQLLNEILREKQKQDSYIAVLEKENEKLKEEIKKLKSKSPQQKRKTNTLQSKRPGHMPTC